MLIKGVPVNKTIFLVSLLKNSYCFKIVTLWQFSISFLDNIAMVWWNTFDGFLEDHGNSSANALETPETLFSTAIDLYFQVKKNGYVFIQAVTESFSFSGFLPLEYLPQNMTTVLLLFALFFISSVLIGLYGGFTHILQGYFTGTGAIIWLPQCQWSNPEGHG